MRRPWERRYDRALAACFAGAALVAAGWFFVAPLLVVCGLAVLAASSRMARRARPRRPRW